MKKTMSSRYGNHETEDYVLLDNMVLIEMAKADLSIKKSSGGILIPDNFETSENKQTGEMEMRLKDQHRHDLASEHGIVRAFGEYAFHDYTIKPKLGDTVLFKKYTGGHELNKNMEGKPWYRIMDYNDIHAIVKTKEGNK
jgi:co-chaperonin GroES (HSP10)